MQKANGSKSMSLIHTGVTELMSLSNSSFVICKNRLGFVVEFRIQMLVRIIIAFVGIIFMFYNDAIF
jgi:hypothetical protein